jgi:hypothetical protein
MNAVPYEVASFRDRYKRRFAFAGTATGLAVLFLFFFPPLSFLILAMVLIGFFLVNPGELIGACPACGNQVMAYRKSSVTACSNCHITIKVDHARKELIEAGKE